MVNVEFELGYMTQFSFIICI